MRIGIDYTSAVQQHAGIGRYTRQLVGALSERDHANEYVLFSVGHDPERKVWPPNFRTRALPLKERYVAAAWQRWRLPLPVELFTGRLDIFHSPDFVLPPLRRARAMLTVHDLSFMRYPECSSPPLLAYLLRAVPHAVARADLILADSESTRRDLLAFFQMPPERVEVVYAGVEPRFTPQADGPARRAILARYGLQRPYILGLGTLQPRKNYVRLIRAFDRLVRARRIPHQLVIAGGRGWLHHAIDETIAALGRQADVRLIGFVADDDLPALYSAADVFAFPSLYEGFGIPVLEAMGCGTPVVASTASSLPEVAGEAALLVPPESEEAIADAMLRLIEDGALRDELRVRGFEQVKGFTWERAAATLHRLYMRIAP